MEPLLLAPKHARSRRRFASARPAAALALVFFAALLLAASELSSGPDRLEAKPEEAGKKCGQGDGSCKRRAAAIKKIGAISIGALATIKIASALMKKPESAGSLPGQTYLGSGIRAKGPISVYSVQMYVGNRAKNALAKFKGKSLKGDKAFLDAFNGGNFQKTVQIKMLRTVAPSKMISAFNDAVSARVSKSTYSKVSESLDALLTKSFTEGTSTKGTEITFSMSGGTAFSISVNKVSQGSIWSADVCKAFTDLYVGKNAVSPGARDSIISGVESMLSS